MKHLWLSSFYIILASSSCYSSAVKEEPTLQFDTELDHDEFTNIPIDEQAQVTTNQRKPLWGFPVITKVRNSFSSAKAEPLSNQTVKEEPLDASPKKSVSTNSFTMVGDNGSSTHSSSADLQSTTVSPEISNQFDSSMNNCISKKNAGSVSSTHSSTDDFQSGIAIQELAKQALNKVDSIEDLLQRVSSPDITTAIIAAASISQKLNQGDIDQLTSSSFTDDESHDDTPMSPLHIDSSKSFSNNNSNATQTVESNYYDYTNLYNLCFGCCVKKPSELNKSPQSETNNTSQLTIINQPGLTDDDEAKKKIDLNNISNSIINAVMRI